MESLRIIVADNEPTYRYGILTYLGQMVTEASLVGQVSSVEELHETLETTTADLIILAWELAVGDDHGWICELAKRQDRPVAVIAVCSDTRISTIVSAFDSGASGVVLRRGEPEEIARAVRRVAAGGRYVCPSTGVAVLERLSDFLAGTLSLEGRRLDTLSDRELEVLDLIAHGMTSKDAALRLSLSVRTIENHRSNIMRKLGIHSTIGLIRLVTAMELHHGSN